jgi:hypothetical protein
MVVLIVLTILQNSQFPLSEQRKKLILQLYLYFDLRHFYLLFPCFCHSGGGNWDFWFVGSSKVSFPLCGEMGHPIFRTFLIMLALHPNSTYSKGGKEEFGYSGLPVNCPYLRERGDI